MLYNSHKDRVWVSECLFWYQLTQIIVDKGLLNRLLLFLLFGAAIADVIVNLFDMLHICFWSLSLSVCGRVCR